MRGDGLEALLADDVAVGDPQRLPPLEAPQGAEHHLIVIEGVNLGHEVLDQHPPRHGGPFGQPQEVETLRIACQQVAEVLAGGEDLHQRGQGGRIALEERAHGQRVAAGGHEMIEVLQRHLRVGEAGQRLGQLLADHRQQVQRQAAGGHGQEMGMGLFGVRHAQTAQPRPRGAGVVEKAAEAGDVHSRGQGSGAGGQGKPHCVRRARHESARMPGTQPHRLHAPAASWRFLRRADGDVVVVRNLARVGLVKPFVAVIRRILAAVVPAVRADTVEQIACAGVR